jgi:simple sugar transport system permease protein
MNQEETLTSAVSAPKQLSLSRRLSMIPETGALVMFLAVFGFFALFAPHFLTATSLAGMLNLASITGTIAIGTTMLMIAGEFDMSVGSIMALAAMTFIQLANAGMNHVLAFVLTFAFMAIIGLINSYLVVQARIPSFIVTLGTLLMGRSAMVLWTQGNIVRLANDSQITKIIAGTVAPGGFRMMGIWFFILIIIFHIVLSQTKFGNAIFATGGAPLAARSMGINTKKIKVMGYLLTASMATLAGIMQLSRIGSINATTGDGLELDAIAASVVGGALLTGGHGSVIGTLFGAMVAGMVRNGLILMGIDSRAASGLIGLALIVAVIINSRLRGGQE